MTLSAFLPLENESDWPLSVLPELQGMNSDSSSSLLERSSPCDEWGILSTKGQVTCLDNRLSNGCARMPSTSSPSDSQTIEGDLASSTLQSGEGVSEELVKQLLFEQVVKRKRLARKAELARLSRKRKRDRLEELEEQVQELQAQLAEAQSKLQNRAPSLKSRNNPIDAESCISRLQFAVERGADDVNALVMDAWKAIQPQDPSVIPSLSLPVRFIEWVLSQDDSFYDDSCGLWQSLFGVQLELDESQYQALSAMRTRAKQLREQGRHLSRTAIDFQSHLLSHRIAQRQQLDAVKCTLNTSQLSRLLMWIEQNKLCVKMLDSMSPVTKLNPHHSSA